MRIMDRDIEILKALEKLRVLDISTIARLCGFKTYGRCAERIKILYDNEYVDYHQIAVSVKRYYFITQKGMDLLYLPEKVLSKKGKEYFKHKQPPKYRKNTAEHEIVVGNVLSWVLECNSNVTIDDFKTDREMQPGLGKNRKIFTHCSDLECEKYRVKIEVELTLKNKDRLRNNISYNGKKWVQVWVAGNQSIYNTLMTEKERFPSLTIFVVMYNELEKNPIILKDLCRYLIRRHPEYSYLLEEEKEHKLEQMTIDDFL